ncbi:hypothetical protein HPP92_013124 [Vanilla planifolia]|uniref:Uncharacterized protein n=1 Tax=Vanilla planifolia TaxID=51239 RepID=A0A835UZQ1_VANPL|nr:hypothetical protein HPP92_013124 [Vanilla planifolia]
MRSPCLSRTLLSGVPGIQASKAKSLPDPRELAGIHVCVEVAGSSGWPRQSALRKWFYTKEMLGL